MSKLLSLESILEASPREPRMHDQVDTVIADIADTLRRSRLASDSELRQLAERVFLMGAQFGVSWQED